MDPKRYGMVSFFIATMMIASKLGAPNLYLPQIRGDHERVWRGLRCAGKGRRFFLWEATDAGKFTPKWRFILIDQIDLHFTRQKFRITCCFVLGSPVSLAKQGRPLDPLDWLRYWIARKPMNRTISSWGYPQSSSLRIHFW